MSLMNGLLGIKRKMCGEGWPYLYVDIELYPIISIKTAEFYQNAIDCTILWVMFKVTIFCKWKFEFKLYSPNRARYNSGDRE